MPKNATIIQVASLARITAGASGLTAPVRMGERGIGGERTADGKRAVMTVNRAQDGASAAIDGTVAIWGLLIGNPWTDVPLGNAYANLTNPDTFPIIPDGTTTTFTSTIPYVAFSNNNFAVDTTAFKITGTLSATVGSTTITGSGTDFGTAGTGTVQVGDTIMLTGSFQVYTVTAIASTTSLTVDVAATVALSGVTAINTTKGKRFKTWITSGSLGSTNPQLFTVNNVGGFAQIQFAVAPPKQVGPTTTPATLVSGMPLDPSCVYFGTPIQILADGVHRWERFGFLCPTLAWVNYTVAATNLSATVVQVEHGTD